MTECNPYRAISLLVAVLLHTLLLVSGAFAQVANAGPDGTVTAVGSATVERKPDVARMQVELSAEGKDAREALANLKSQEKAIREKLAKLGAADGMVRFEDARVNTAGSNQRAQMEQMIRSRSFRPGKPPATGPSQTPVSVAATLKVDWPLKAESADDLLVEAHELQAKVKAANLIAPAKPGGGTPEEQEEAEERFGLAMAEAGGVNPGEPVFMYVGRMSDDERAKATAEAFKKAKDEAARVARAAGAELGALRQLTSNAGANTDDPYGSMDYSNPFQRQYYNMVQRQQAGAAETSEAIGMQPGKVSYRVMVSASFALK